ncbi:hypothetical protein [Rhizobium leguminosarum]|uniref:hypothetical protein n=1 Tax=Rhizobium leguminosarum TaxID=384 RepID=UPI0011AE9701|nr:hypothetical protein [Rhizobium leguminosarum]
MFPTLALTSASRGETVASLEHLGGHSGSVVFSLSIFLIGQTVGYDRLENNNCLFLAAQAVFGHAINQAPVLLRHSLTQLTQLHRQNCIRWNSTTAQRSH